MEKPRSIPPYKEKDPVKISKNTVVSANYILRDSEGSVIDESGESGPMEYLHGVGEIIEGLEKALEGKKVGDHVKVSLSAEDAYGEFDDDLVQEVSKEMFADMDDLEEGLVFHAETEEGVQEYAVVAIEGDMVTIDGNHPLAGEDLTFEIDVLEVRQATAEELEHGHAHGEGCDHDHDEE
jgi:FKBP-type peptidyl-prolyl cis-trans isomerase SlyD